MRSFALWLQLPPLLSVLGFEAARMVDGFIVSSSSSSPLFQTRTDERRTPACPRRRKATQQPLKLSSNYNDNEPLEYLTPNQVKTLRKEASKRQARKLLPRIALDQGYDAILESLESNELVVVSGISKNNKREVFASTEELSYELSRQSQKDIFVVETKGFTATLYSPFVVPEIKLFNSYRPGQWTRRVKGERDNAGQIIRDKKRE